jgi:hypothetical protein
MKSFNAIETFGYHIPKVHQEFVDCWNQDDLKTIYLESYESGKQSFVPLLLPEIAVQFHTTETLAILRKRLGSKLDVALDPKYTDPDNIPETLPEEIRSPVINEPNGNWLKLCNMVGINVRTCGCPRPNDLVDGNKAFGSFWNIVKYALTLPEAVDSIHILPIWEAGVVGSIYGISSWLISREHYSKELEKSYPHLNTPGKQLRAVINILHAMGRTVGMDVIPHTDRFSQMVFTHPHYYEWLQRQDAVIIDHSDNLYQEVQAKIFEFIRANGSAVEDEKIPETCEEFYSDTYSEEQRIRILFGEHEQFKERENRRNQLVKHLYSFGLEPVPGTMAPPFRGLKVNQSPDGQTEDEYGMIWRDYVITKPEGMSRVFGPLSPFKYYGRLDDNLDWQVDFDRPIKEVWDYVCDKYHQVQSKYGFDFMRGDMSHVQMRKDGVPKDKIEWHYDILGTVKNYIRGKGAQYFGYFAETFLPPRDVFGYGEEMDHLEASDAETTLGNLQSTSVGSPVFMQCFRQYLDYLETRLCAPNFTVITGDKDDPRFDEFYVKGNEARLFIGYFLTDMPSYMGLGFQSRGLHYSPKSNEHYTKLYVFQESGHHNVYPGKSTHKPYIWGKNGFQFRNITRLKLFADQIWNTIKNRKCRWLIPPDATAENKIVAWTQQENPEYVFIVNLNMESDIMRFAIPFIPNADSSKQLQFAFSTADYVPEEDRNLIFNGKHYKVLKMTSGEGRVYRI